VKEYRRRKYAFNSVFAIQKDIQKITDLNKQWETLLISKSKKETELEGIIKESKSLKSLLKHVFNIGTIDYQDLIRDKENMLAEIKKQIDLLIAEVNLCFLRIKNVDTHSQPIRELIQNIDTHNFSAIGEQLTHASKQIEDYLIRKEALSHDYTELNDEELNDLKTQHEKNYKKIESMKVEERINKCSIIGMTLDSYIGRFSNVQIDFSNIFLDEAGYAPLIKALTLFSNKCGITLLGDHRQLPPVCEFDTLNTIPGFYRLLWSKPSIFSETVLNYDEEDCLNIADNADCPEFKYTEKSILLETYRYGANLAELLDRLIYNIGYKSALSDEHNIELCFIDAPSPNVKDGRRNENECEKICNILNGFLDEDYCILTPYKDQVSFLQRSLQRARQEERILTIHKSQGREWNTVILSIVDGSNIRPWFTDSTDPVSQGLYVLNTAVSRAQKKLIIVCDANYWLSRQDAEIQLISNLINISKKLE